MDSRRNNTDLAQQFGELRSLLLQPSSEQSWRTLTHALEQWPDPEHLEHVVVPYVKDHLERWDPALRRAPHSWKHALTHALEDSPFLHTLGELSLAARFDDVRHLALHEDVGQSSYPEEISSFDVLLEPFLEQARWLERLEVLSLSMHDNASSDIALEMLFARFARTCSRLERLTVRADELSPQALESFTALLDNNPYLQRLDIKTLRQLDDVLLALSRSSTHPPELSLSCYRRCDLGSLLDHEHMDAHRFTTLELALDAVRRTEHIAWVLTHPSMAHLSHLDLDFQNVPPPEDAFSFQWARHPGALQELLSLKLSGDYLHSSSIDALAERGVFTHLRELTIADSDLSEPHTLAELTTGVSHALQKLTISHKFTRGALDLGATLASPTLRGLESLSCHNLYDSGHSGVAKLARMRHLEGLELLSLRRLTIDDVAANELGASAVLGNLRTLDLRHNGLSEQGLSSLSKSFHLYRLESLTLSGNAITPASAMALAQAGWLSQVRELTLRGCQLGDVASRVLWSMQTQWPVLRSLDLATNELSVQALISLCEHEAIGQLQWLNVHDNPGTADEAFAEYLSRADHLPPWLLASLLEQVRLTTMRPPS